MDTLDLEVDGDVIRVSLGPAGPVEVLRNAIVIRDDRQIVAIFSESIDMGLVAPNTMHRVRRPFQVAAFDPVLAEAVTWYLVRRNSQRTGGFIRRAFRRSVVRLRWPDWSMVSPDLRRAFLREIARTADVEVNGRIAVRTTRWRSLMGKGAVIENWAVGGSSAPADLQ